MMALMRYTLWLRGAILVGIFATLLIPFIIANGNLTIPANWLFPVNSFFPFITGKNFVFRIIVEVIFGLYVLLALREPKYRPRFSIILISILGFVAWVGFTTFFSVDLLKSFWSNFERMEGYVTIFHLLLYFLVVSAVINTERLWTWFLRCSVLASVFMSFYGMAQLGGVFAIDQGGVRLTGTLGNAIYFAVYMLFNIFFALLLMYRERRETVMVWLYGAAIVLDLVMLLYSETRGTMLGLFGGLFIAAVYFWFAARSDVTLRRMRAYALYGIVGLVVLGGLFVTLRNQPFIKEIPGLGRLASISLEGGETKTRIVIWGMAWEGFKERPIVGWGQENFSFVFNKYYEPELYTQEAWFDRAHNSYVDWALNAGALGLLLFIALIVGALWAVMRVHELPVVERTILVGLLVAFAIHEFFVFDNIVSWIQFFTLLAFIHLFVRREVPRTVWMSRPVSDNGLAVAAPIVGIVVIVGVWQMVLPGIVGATSLLKALQPTNPPDAMRNLAYYQGALGASPLGRQEATEQLITAAITVNGTQNVAPETKQEYYKTAFDAIDGLTKQRPHDARLELFYGNFLRQFGKIDEARKQFELAREDSPRKQQILLQLGVDIYLHSGDIKNALSTLKTAFELAPTYDDARIYYAVALYVSGNTVEADRLLVERFGTAEVDNSVLVTVFYTTKQYERAAKILKKRLEGNPGDLQSWIQLAGIYYMANDRANAIATLRAAAAANPESAERINALIEEVRSGKAQ